ncbi:IMCp domain-containing protein, partial [Mesomycoplasma ovipneumoniae]
NHNATCPWCQKYRTYLLETKNCPACLAKFKEQNFDLDAKINLLRSNSYYNNLANNIKCKACFHNASCQWCQKYATYLLEAKNCPACLAKFRAQNFDLEKKLKELRTNDLQKLTSLIWQQTYNSPCPACNHNFFCPKCRKLAAYYREARKCQACQLILKKKNIDIEQKIAELSFYPYYESRALLRYNLFESDSLFNQNCSSCLHVYSCRFCQKYRTYLLEAKNCPACKYLFAKKGISIDYLLKVINFWNHPDSFNHVDPLSVLKHGRPIVHEKIVEIVDIPKIEIVEPPRIEIVEIPQIVEPPKIVEPVLDYSWVKIHPYYPQIGTYELNKFPAIIPLFQGIVYQAFLDLNRSDHSSIVDDELFNTKRGFGGYNVQSSGGLSVGLGDLSVDEATRVIAASTSSVDEDEEIIIVATEKSTIWGLPSYVLWFIVFALIAVILVVVIMFILYGAGII